MQPTACKQCGMRVPAGHRFCGRCGTQTDRAAATLSPSPGNRSFQAEEVTNGARLIVLRGDGGDVGSYELQTEEHPCGRVHGTVVFPDDNTLSPRHANFYYRNGRLYCRDLGSTNGTFIRLKERIPIVDGDHFICGEQRFEFRRFPAKVEERWITGTCFCGTPKLGSWRYQVGQILDGGRGGEIRCADTESISIGRSDCELNFPYDPFMSQAHASVQEENGEYFLVDDSRNGTYFMINDEVGLTHGDYIYVGRQLLMVEFS